MLNVNIDKITNMIEQPDVWLCHRDYGKRGKICLLSPIADLKVYVTSNAVDEVSFTIHKFNNGIEFEYWDEIKDLKIICVDGFGYFEIAVDKEESDDTTKVITGISTEAELGQINVDNLEINGENDKNNNNNWDNLGAYIPTVIYSFTDPEHSLLHRLLSYAPSWSLGSIASEITENNVKVSTSVTKRTFNFSNRNVYDALQEIASELDVVFVFNTVTRTINMYDLNEIGEDTTIFVSTENLATDFTCTSNKDNVKNCFKIIGGDENINLAIRTVNPNGSNYIYYFSPKQKEDMSNELITKMDAYDAFYESEKDGYNQCCQNLYDAIDEVAKLETTMMPGREPDADTTAVDEVAKLTASKIGNVSVQSLSTLYKTGAEKAIKTIAQVMIDYRYEVDIESGSYNNTAYTWTGKFKVTETVAGDSAISSSDITLSFVEDEKQHLQDKINEICGDIDISDELDIDTFKSDLKSYSLSNLESFKSCYQECANILMERGYANESEKENNTEFYALYYSYYEKLKACEEEIAVRKAEIEVATKKQQQYENEVKAYHDKLNFEKYLGEDLYNEFCLYRREDVYQNDNYISDGQNNSELLQNAQRLVEVATKELYKASQFQTVYSANLNNLFTNPIYKPFYNHFDLFNWIHAEIDNEQVMLRIIGITFDFSSIEKIEVEFSEQVRNANGITDLESILGQAKNMATSYSSTVKQALSGQEASLEFDALKQEGLNSALMNIKNSNNEEVVIDNCGINCRSKDQNDQYDQHQLRIMGKNIVLTKDDFETASMAIGAGLYKGQEVYGVWGDLICGDILIGKELNILNSNSTLTMDENGLTITNGVNTIVFDPNNTELMNVTNNDKKIFYLNELGDLFIDGNIFGGSLHLENDLGTYVDINPDKENIMEIANKEDKIKNEFAKLNDTVCYYEFITGQYTTDNLEDFCSYDGNLYGTGISGTGLNGTLYLWNKNTDTWDETNGEFYKIIDKYSPLYIFIHNSITYMICYNEDYSFYNLLQFNNGLYEEPVIVLKELPLDVEILGVDDDYLYYYKGNSEYVTDVGVVYYHFAYRINLNDNNFSIDSFEFMEEKASIGCTAYKKNVYNKCIYAIMRGNIDGIYSAWIVKISIEHKTYEKIFQLPMAGTESGRQNLDGSDGLIVICDKYMHIFGKISIYSSSLVNEAYHYIFDLEKNIFYTFSDMPSVFYEDTTDIFVIDNTIHFLEKSTVSHFTMNTLSEGGNSKKVFYVTKDGNACFTGDVVAKSLTLSEDATVEGTVISNEGNIGGWVINEDSLSTEDFDNSAIGTKLSTKNYGQIMSKSSEYYAMLYDGKYIFGVWDESMPFLTGDKKYVDISALGIYARGTESTTYLFEVNNIKDTVTVYSTTDDKALSVVNFGTGNTLYLQNAESSYRNAALRAYVVHDYAYEDDEGNEQIEKRSAYVSLFGEKENGRIVFRADLGGTTTDYAYEQYSTIGTTGFRWGTGYFGKLYTDSGSITDSDAKIKTIVDDLDNELALDFINNLKPTQYYYNNSNNQRIHMGFIAQEVNQLAKDLDMGNMSLYEAVKVDENGKEYYYSDEYDDEELKWSLNYTEFIAPLVGSVQALTKRVEDLEAEIKELKGE